MRQLALGIAVGLGFLCSCADLGSEKPTDRNPGNDGGLWQDEPDCDDDKTETPWDLDEGIPAELVTPRDLIDLAVGMRQGALAWKGSGAGVKVEPSSGETEVALELRYTGGEIVLHEHGHEGCPVPGVTIELELDLATTDGAFAETFEVMGEAWNDGIRVSRLLDQAELQGFFSATPTGPNAHVDLLLEADTRASHTSGRIFVHQSNRDASPHEAVTWQAAPVY